MNVTNESEEYIPYDERCETYLVPAVFFVVFVLGFVGNGTLILIFLRNRSMRSIPNIYIMSLAVGDFFVITGSVPFISTIYTFESWPYGEFLCKLSEFLRDVSVGVTVLTLTILSVDRYVAIVLPIQKHTGQHAKTMTMIFALSIWCVAIAIATPGAYYSFLWRVTINHEKVIHVCYPFPEEMLPWYPRSIVLVKFLLLYAIPLMFIATCYILMAKHLFRSSKNIVGTNATHVKQLRARAKVAKIVLAFVVIFAFSFFPNHVFLIWYYFHPTSMDDYDEFWHAWKIMGYVLSFANSCLNPIALYTISGVYRAYFRRYLLRCCKHNRRTLRRKGDQGTLRSISGRNSTIRHTVASHL